MKTKLFLGLMLFLGLSFRGSAQSTAEANGIAIQGIARDDNNTAMADEDIKLEFTIYFLDSSNNPANIYTENKTLHTDAFGVFSHVIQPGNVNYSKIANTEAYLKIEDADGVVFSDEKLKMVPYAVSAYNGVPTGAIMPFLGTTAPDGWMLCDGSAIPNTAAGTYLKALLGGNNVPDLRGTFLRGTGTSPTNGQNGPNLNGYQGENLKSHLHYVDLQTSLQGDHNHTNGSYSQLLANDGRNTVASLDNSAGEPKLTSSATMLPAGSHIHDVEGNTNNFGGNETRPVNYGVNYIIKL
ncbi:MAG: hypothetical protein CL868_18435 [Cytophagaceae bacterium]|nr:hypothetical protein [Cytophagaceae bacterium]|tara:strand:- start:12999 stop:13886 length:888 start_codon:yes stop_codon:yes gene_type:complete